jgi:hypothetical protein
MSEYKDVFSQVLNEEISNGEELSDGDAWAAGNKSIVDDANVARQFDVEGLPKDLSAQYLRMVESFKSEVQRTAKVFVKLYEFSTKSSSAKGGGQIYATTGKAVNKLTTDLGTLDGLLSTLKADITMDLRVDQEERSEAQQSAAAM